MTQTVTPQFRITDARRSVPFYVDGLGFEVDWEHRFEPGLPVFMKLTRAGQSVFLTEHAGDCQVGGAAYFVVPDVDACSRDFAARGAVLAEPPEDTPWGTREMLVTDPDGNRLRFASPLEPAAASERPPEPGRPSPAGVDRRLVPALLVRDMGETLAFYEKLGFRLTGCSPSREAPTWAEVKRHSVLLQFHIDPPVGTPPEPVCSGTFYIVSEGVAALAERLRDEVEVAWGPEVLDYGMREFAIRDPNGYFIAFTEPA